MIFLFTYFYDTGSILDIRFDVILVTVFWSCTLFDPSV